MLEILNELDKNIFLFLNGFHSNLFDIVMWWFSDKLIWIPLYIYLLYLIVRKYGWESIAIILSLALLIVLSDQISNIIKDSVQRLRPSHDPAIMEQVKTVNAYMGGNYGFVSAHTANSFALVYFLYKFLKLDYTLLGPILLFWAFLISYSRIYLGVHYPGDVIGGAILGLALAWAVVNVYKRINKYFGFSKQY